MAITASAANAARVGEVGADVVVDDRTQDFEGLLDGFDVVFDDRGGKALEEALGVLGVVGRSSASPGRLTPISPASWA
ncbi:hypothetical protein [Kitasatospora sp. NPDC005748]|uniref:hypothetical protein n=1 Tax=Kitasatospora sp. NPDC005748 TaxID=3157063 RepID=UPI0033E66EC1